MREEFYQSLNLQLKYIELRVMHSALDWSTCKDDIKLIVRLGFTVTDFLVGSSLELTIECLYVQMMTLT